MTDTTTILTLAAISWTLCPVGIAAAIAWRRAEKRALRLSELNVGLAYRNDVLKRANENLGASLDLVSERYQARSRAGKTARACQLRQTHDKVASKTAELRQELRL